MIISFEGISQLTDDIQADRYLIEAKGAMESGNYSKAADSFGEILKLDVTPPPVFNYFYGKSLQKSRNYAKSLKFISKYINEEGREGEFYQEALSIYSKAEKQIENITDRIQKYIQEEKYAKAKKELKDNKKELGGNYYSIVYYWNAKIYYAENNWNKALQYCDNYSYNYNADDAYFEKITNLKTRIQNAIDTEKRKEEQAILEKERQTEEERNYWTEKKNTNTINSYESYLRRYPSGKYSTEAKKNIKTLAYDKDLKRVENGYLSFCEFYERHPYSTSQSICREEMEEKLNDILSQNKNSPYSLKSQLKDFKKEYPKWYHYTNVEKEIDKVEIIIQGKKDKIIRREERASLIVLSQIPPTSNGFTSIGGIINPGGGRFSWNLLHLYFKIPKELGEEDSDVGTYQKNVFEQTSVLGSTLSLRATNGFYLELGPYGGVINYFPQYSNDEGIYYIKDEKAKDIGTAGIILGAKVDIPLDKEGKLGLGITGSYYKPFWFNPDDGFSDEQIDEAKKISTYSIGVGLTFGL